MILVDANILLYAENKQSPVNDRAKSWWDEQLNGETPVCLCWTILSAFIRIATNSRVFEHPLSLSSAVNRVQSWLDQPSVHLIYPTENHWATLRVLLIEGQAVANLVTDAHLAALAVTHGCVLYSTDADFSRFSRLKWKNPLVASNDVPPKRK